MIEVQAPLSLPGVESDLSRVLAQPEAEVLWPSPVGRTSLGSESALVQAIATWAARARKPSLLLPYAHATDDEIDAYLQNIQGLTAGLLADTVRDRSGRDLTSVVRGRSILKLYQQDGIRTRDALVP